ncbi:sugar transferase [Cupriavidus sp. WKF15]|uniref:sugar transferase n=1 Tax=Cupriavidus sp. WKF15 TaxID=3032282 RepID=UPI0023E098E6|nr:sugar transferase [Cupriavidus sp. WKF15]WER49575.1 sugar transferase [Cupriavidus sp. WKF15]
MKRALDVVIALVALVVLALPLLIVVALVRSKLGSPVFFRQTRAGLNGKPIEVIKFRTMTDERGADGELLPDTERITPFGWVIRRTSIDELPELWCVLKGDMSLVGPRPLLMEYLPFYTAEQARRLLVKPGISGWAQVNGRNSLSWEEKFRLDVWYVDHQSIWLDIRILWRTIGTVLAKEDISAAGEVSATRFDVDMSRKAQ